MLLTAGKKPFVLMRYRLANICYYVTEDDEVSIYPDRLLPSCWAHCLADLVRNDYAFAGYVPAARDEFYQGFLAQSQWRMNHAINGK